MTGLSVDADISADTDLLGLTVSDLQTDVEVGTDTISGTLKYVTDYEGFSGLPEEQEGNYLALHFESDAADSLSVKLSGSPLGEQTLDADGLAIFRITSTEQTITVTAKKEGYFDESKVYSLSGLTLEEET